MVHLGGKDKKIVSQGQFSGMGCVFTHDDILAISSSPRLMSCPPSGRATVQEKQSATRAPR
jgi:hypothetical protein